MLSTMAARTDGIIALNSNSHVASFVFTRPPNFKDEYDAQRTTEHEIDEVMGLGSILNCNDCSPGEDQHPSALSRWYLGRP